MKLHREERLEGVHPDLAGVIRLAADYVPFDLVVLEGVRSKERQEHLVSIGASKTLKSRHIPNKDGYACASDVAPMLDTDGDGDKEPSWHWPQYDVLAAAMKKAAKELGIPVEWGGDWKSFKDGPHWQLPWAEYP